MGWYLSIIELKNARWNIEILHVRYLCTIMWSVLLSLNWNTLNICSKSCHNQPHADITVLLVLLHAHRRTNISVT